MDTSKCQYPAPGPWKNKVSSNTLFLEGVFYFIGRRLMKKNALRGLHCSGKEGCRESGSPQAEKPAKGVSHYRRQLRAWGENLAGVLRRRYNQNTCMMVPLSAAHPFRNQNRHGEIGHGR